MIETREAHVRRARDVAHRRRVVTLLREDACRRAQNEFELLIVTRNGQGSISWFALLCVSVPLWFVLARELLTREAQRHREDFSEPHVFKIKRLALDSGCGRRDPVRDLAEL